MKPVPLKILLEPGFLQDELREKLLAAGCTIDTVPPEYDVILGSTAWRIPPGSTPAEITKYIDMVLKQVRATKRAQNPPPEKGTDPVHKVSRKRTTKAKTTKLDDTSVEGC